MTLSRATPGTHGSRRPRRPWCASGSGWTRWALHAGQSMSAGSSGSSWSTLSLRAVQSGCALTVDDSLGHLTLDLLVGGRLDRSSDVVDDEQNREQDQHVSEYFERSRALLGCETHLVPREQWLRRWSDVGWIVRNQGSCRATINGRETLKLLLEVDMRTIKLRLRDVPARESAALEIKRAAEDAAQALDRDVVTVAASGRHQTAGLDNRVTGGHCVVPSRVERSCQAERQN